MCCTDIEDLLMLLAICEVGNAAAFKSPEDYHYARVVK